MTKEVISTDITGMPDLIRLAQEVATTGKTRLLKNADGELAVLSPVRPPRARRATVRPLQRAAIEALAGAWEGRVDPEELKRELREAQWDDRPAARL